MHSCFYSSLPILFFKCFRIYQSPKYGTREHELGQLKSEFCVCLEYLLAAPNQNVEVMLCLNHVSIFERCSSYIMLIFVGVFCHVGSICISNYKKKKMEWKYFITNQSKRLAQLGFKTKRKYAKFKSSMITSPKFQMGTNS